MKFTITQIETAFFNYNKPKDLSPDSQKVWEERCCDWGQFKRYLEDVVRMQFSDELQLTLFGSTLAELPKEKEMLNEEE